MLGLTPEGTLGRFFPKLYGKISGQARDVKNVSMARGRSVPVPRPSSVNGRNRDELRGLSERNTHMGAKGYGSIIIESMARFPEVRIIVNEVVSRFEGRLKTDADRLEMTQDLFSALSELETIPSDIDFLSHTEALESLACSDDPVIRARAEKVAFGILNFNEWMNSESSFYHFGKRMYGQELEIRPDTDGDGIQVKGIDSFNDPSIVRINDIHVDDFVLILNVNVNALSSKQRKKLDNLRTIRHNNRKTGLSIYDIQKAVAMDPDLRDIVNEAAIIEFKLGDKDDYPPGKQDNHTSQAGRYLFHAHYALKQQVAKDEKGRLVHVTEEGIPIFQQEFGFNHVPSIEEWPQINQTYLAYFGDGIDVMKIGLEDLEQIRASEVFKRQLIVATRRVLNSPDIQDWLKSIEEDENGLIDSLLKTIQSHGPLTTPDILRAVVFSGMWIPHRDGSIVINLNDLDLFEQQRIALRLEGKGLRPEGKGLSPEDLAQLGYSFALPERYRYPPHEDINIQPNNLSLVITKERGVGAQKGQAVAFLICYKGRRVRILHRFEIRDPDDKPVSLKTLAYDFQNVMPQPSFDKANIPFDTGRFPDSVVKEWLLKLIGRFRMNAELDIHHYIRRRAERYLNSRNIDYEWAVKKMGMLVIRGVKDLHNMGLLPESKIDRFQLAELRVALGKSKGSTFGDNLLLKGAPRLAFPVIDIEKFLKGEEVIVGFSTREIKSSDGAEGKSILPSHMTYLLADAVAEYTQYKYLFGNPLSADYIFLVEGIFDYLSIAKFLEDAGLNDDKVCIIGNVGLHGLDFLDQIRKIRENQSFVIIDGFDRYRDERRDYRLRQHREEDVLRGTSLFWNIAGEIMRDLRVNIPEPEKTKDLNDLHAYLLEANIYDVFTTLLRERLNRILESGALVEAGQEP